MSDAARRVGVERAVAVGLGLGCQGNNGRRGAFAEAAYKPLQQTSEVGTGGWGT